MKVLVLGAGKMMEAMLTGIKEKENLSEWFIWSPSGTSAGKLAGKVGARAISDLSQIKAPDWVFIGCKPQQLKDLSVALGGRFGEALFVSILAAVSEDDQREILGVKELIRVMPNIPVAQREGVLLLSSVSARSRLSSFQTLFSRLGTALIVEERELEELTLLTGSGPAFFYEFAKSLANSFDSLTEDQREKLVKQVFRGAAAQSATSSLEELTHSVTSKGGVTIAVLEAWRSAHFADFLKKGIEAGKKRSLEIRESLRS
jgi:pyrroline-5-carboxylate reductase